MPPYNKSICDVCRIHDDSVLISVLVDFDVFVDCD